MTKTDKEDLLKLFKGKKRVSINFKLAVVIILAGVIAVGAFLLLGLLEDAIVRSVATSKSIKEDAVNERFRSLEKYIAKNNIKGDDTAKLQSWLKHEHYTEVVTSDRTGDIFTGGVVSSAGRRFGAAGAGSVDASDKRKNIAKEGQDVYNREIRFLDKNYYVYINVYLEYRWQNILDNIRLLICAVLFLILVLVYNKRVLGRIIRLSNEVSLISEGELDREIVMGDDDEIGTLANDVDTMRTAIVGKMNNEKAAWDANTQLITSMSHDIRTPLTSLIGYLDIISGHKYKNEEELQKYIDSCSDKAVQLKDLSDKLFQYFLVYNNNQSQERELEILDAGILFQQFMIEHISELTQYDYQVNLRNDIPESIMIATETSAMQRLFDNLFSNIMKYASSDFPVEITAEFKNCRIEIVLSNHIAEVAKKVESTKIGVKTCKKIVEDLSGTFHALEEDNIYTTEIYFPIKEVEASQDENRAEDEELPEPSEDDQSIVDAIKGGDVTEE